MTPLEHRQVVDSAKLAVKRRRPAKDQSDQVEDRKKPKTTVSLLTFKQVKQGLVTLGVIRKVNELDLEICLPNQLIGYCAITEISDLLSNIVAKAADADDSQDLELPDLNEMFSKGQYVVCTPTIVDNKKIELTLNPRLVNAFVGSENICIGECLQAVFISKEEHGYLLDFGIKGVKGFLRIDSSFDESNNGNHI